ncbi:MAG: YtxH domain-containing protein [Nitrospiraceae bacterium]
MGNGTRCVTMSSFTLLTGFLAGVAAGLLLAPQAGSRTRRQLRNFAEDLGERATLMAEDAKQAVEEAVDEVLEKGKQLVNK